MIPGSRASRSARFSGKLVTVLQPITFVALFPLSRMGRVGPPRIGVLIVDHTYALWRAPRRDANTVRVSQWLARCCAGPARTGRSPAAEHRADGSYHGRGRRPPACDSVGSTFGSASMVPRARHGATGGAWSGPDATPARPFRETPIGLSLGGGVSVPYVRGDTHLRPYLATVIDIEGHMRGRVTPAVQIGLGGGTRVGFVLRTSPSR
jgi:hypothetical protein